MISHQSIQYNLRTLRRRKEGVFWAKAAAGYTFHPIQGRVMQLLNLVPFLLLAMQTQSKPCKWCQIQISPTVNKILVMILYSLPVFDFGTFFGNGVSASFHTALGRDCRGRAQGDYFYGCQVHNNRSLDCLGGRGCFYWSVECQGLPIWVSAWQPNVGIVIFSVSVSSMWEEENGHQSFSAATRWLDGQTCWLRTFYMSFFGQQWSSAQDVHTLT